MTTGGILSDNSWQTHGLMDEFAKLQHSMTNQQQQPTQRKSSHGSAPQLGPRMIRVVQVGKKGPDGHATFSPPRMRPVASDRAEGHIPASSSKQRRASGERRPGSRPKSQQDVSFEDSTELSSRKVSPRREGHNLFAVGFNEPKHPAKGPEPLLPYVPRRPQDVCKTYNHIFKLLNDPGMSKHAGGGKQMPKQKQAVHVSMPRLPSAGADTVGNSSTQYSAAEGVRPPQMYSSKSSPTLHSSAMPAQPSWQSASMRGDVEGVVGDRERLVLPPLAKSATR